jgi:crotonobetainyl-CoA:carnitine CoA-transferase CaiB-like acyl-CoA transferase
VTVSLPLEGVVILDLTRLLPGNYGTLLLADLGADVIKVEEPGQGDYIRWIPPTVDGEGAIHRALNRNKRSVTLNLKAPEGAATLRRLAAGADALIESFRPGVMDRLGVGYEALASENPRLVYCAITGYGQDGPYRDRVGHDINYIGYSGLLHASGPAGGDPVIPAVPIGDFSGGMAAALGTVAALAEGRAGGRGRFVDVSMLDVVGSWLGVIMSSFLATGEVPPRGRMRLTGGWACYRVYRTADGKHLSVGAIEPQFWFTLCEAVGAPELVGEQWSPRQEEIAGRLQEIFERRPRDEWLRELAHLETCVGPVNDVGEALADPQVAHRGLVAAVGDAPVGPGAAIKLSGVSAREPLAAPGFGKHTDEVLAWAGCSPSEIATLRERGVV